MHARSRNVCLAIQKNKSNHENKKSKHLRINKKYSLITVQRGIQKIRVNLTALVEWPITSFDELVGWLVSLLKKKARSSMSHLEPKPRELGL